MGVMWLGIDGGGSNLRVVVVDDQMQILATANGEGVNPNAVGYEVATKRIQSAIQQVATGINISGVGIGIAGAAARHAAPWLIEVVQTQLPHAAVFPSSDEEIALVGARGELNGVVLIAGTGSVAYGMHPDGRTYRAGGWGYLLGDEGSGYWIGLQALQALTRRADGRLTSQTSLPERVMTRLQLNTPDDIITWLYSDVKSSRVAALAQLVLEAADADDPHAALICDQAAAHLVNLIRHVQHQLDLPDDVIVFAGGLLTHDNALSRRVLKQLNFDQLPDSRYPPVVGAALLAKLRSDVNRTT
ncbi:MAG: hypothetical protein CUN56_02430 [Phototrophicales bacterium]|nr:MAG: hypothetical protein CUN56_02430 [Phototrophicales bacterium]